jgi:hypothetical protein
MKISTHDDLLGSPNSVASTVKSAEDGDDRPPIVRPLGMQTRWEPTVASRTITAMEEPRSWDQVAAGLVVDFSLFLCSYAPLFAIQP